LGGGTRAENVRRVFTGNVFNTAPVEVPCWQARNDEHPAGVGNVPAPIWRRYPSRRKSKKPLKTQNGFPRPKKFVSRNRTVLRENETPLRRKFFAQTREPPVIDASFNSPKFKPEPLLIPKFLQYPTKSCNNYFAWEKEIFDGDALPGGRVPGNPVCAARKSVRY
jgi:hypothetical protein